MEHQKEIELNASLGRFIRDYGHLEMTLGMLAARLAATPGRLDHDDQTAVAVMAHHLDARGLTSYLRYIGPHRFDVGPALESLRDLCKRMDELTRRRNDVIHRPPLSIISLPPPTEPRWGQYTGRRAPPRGGLVVEDFRPEELADLTQECQGLMGIAAIILEAIGGPAPS